jgi:Predicted Zn-dependent protease (DUF2268)
MTTNPLEAHLETADIARFWKAWDASTPETAQEVFQREYFDAGSSGLQDFIASRIGSVDALLETLNLRPLYFAAIRANTLRVESMRTEIVSVFQKLKVILLGAVFPDVYFLIGRMNSGGTLSERSIQIGLEFFSSDTETPLEELNDWERGVVKPLSALPMIVAHELMHYQHSFFFNQFNGLSIVREFNLLENVYLEGIAEFFGELISGGVINEDIHAYGRAHEVELWRRFQREMYGNDSSGWLYQGVAAKDEPADLGYFIGYQIVKAYYEKATDRRAALHTLLTTNDMAGIVRKSNYDTTQ